MSQPKLLVFASGSAEGGGSGFEKLVLATREGILDAEIVGVVSNHGSGGVVKRAGKLGVPIAVFPAPWDAVHYRKFVNWSGAAFVALSGWLKPVVGLDPRTTFNIHPGPLPEYGGKGMYGHHVHEAVMAAFHRGEITHSAVCMHFVTTEYDQGPVFFRFNVRIHKNDTPETLAERVNKWEHYWQPRITHSVVHREISWDGKDPSSLRHPTWYRIDRKDE